MTLLSQLKLVQLYYLDDEQESPEYYFKPSIN